MTQFKDKSAKGGEGAASVGLFTYPILQAADILLYRPHYVPVGEDQRQHLELTRDLAQRFNHRYKKTFRLPEPYILKATAKICDLQDPTAKMSKSASSPAGIIEMLDEPGGRARRRSARRSPTRAPRSASTRRRSPGVSNLLTIYCALTARSIADLEEEYAGQGLRRPQEGPRRGGRRLRDAVPRAHPGAARRPGPPHRRAAPGRGARPARWPRRRCATSTSGSASSPPPGRAVGSRGADHRSGRGDPGALGDRSCRTTAPPSATPRRR